jgi:hypothetical protein
LAGVTSVPEVTSVAALIVVLPAKVLLTRLPQSGAVEPSYTRFSGAGPNDAHGTTPV